MELKLKEKYMLTIKEAVAYYGIGIKFLRRCAENGDSKFGIICGNRWMIIKDRFEEYLCRILHHMYVVIWELSLS